MTMEKKHTNYYAYDNFECFELVDEEKKYREKIKNVNEYRFINNSIHNFWVSD